MLLSLPVGSTSKIIQIPIFDSSSTTGAMLTGLVFNTASLTAYYNREGAAGAATAITLVTATKGTWTSSGFIAVDGTNTPGWYELHVPDAALASGAKSVVLHLKGAANMVPVPILIELTANSNQDAVRGGMTALPNVASGSAGAVVTSGTGTAQLSVSSGLVTLAGVTHTGAVIPTVSTVTGLTASNLDATVSGRMATYTQPTGFLAATFPAGTVANTTNITAGTITTTTNLTTNNDKTGYGLSAAAVQAIWDAATTALTVVGSIGKKLADWTIGTAQTGDSFARLGAPAGASVSADVAAVKVDSAAVKVKTDFLPSATAGAAGGVFIAGTNAATTITTALTTTFTGSLTGSVGSLAAQAKADVKAEAVAALATDTYAEPAQGAPAATTTLAAKINYIYKFLRNKVTTTATTVSVYDDAGTTVDQKSTISDDATTFTRGEYGSGP